LQVKLHDAKDAHLPVECQQLYLQACRRSGMSLTMMHGSKQIHCSVLVCKAHACGHQELMQYGSDAVRSASPQLQHYWYIVMNPS